MPYSKKLIYKNNSEILLEKILNFHLDTQFSTFYSKHPFFSQFHQHFNSRYSANFLASKKYKDKLKLRKIAKLNFVQKNSLYNVGEIKILAIKHLSSSQQNEVVNIVKIKNRPFQGKISFQIGSHCVRAHACIGPYDHPTLTSRSTLDKESSGKYFIKNFAFGFHYNYLLNIMFQVDVNFDQLLGDIISFDVEINISHIRSRKQYFGKNHEINLFFVTVFDRKSN